VIIRPVPVEQTRGLRQRVLRPLETLAEMAAHEPADAFAVGAFRGDELLGVGLIGPEGRVGDWRIRGMATAPQARRQGIGAAVLDVLLAHASTAEATRVWCSARTPARSLYERAGFRVASEEFEVQDIGPHVVMERLLRDRA
jgi:ribosomal protein S18 acetylase RimI-like enzyme